MGFVNPRKGFVKETKKMHLETKIRLEMSTIVQMLIIFF